MAAQREPDVNPHLAALRADMTRLLGPIEGRKVPLAQVNAAWRACSGADVPFDLMKYQTCSKRKSVGLRQLLMCIPETVELVTAPGPNARHPDVEWVVLRVIAPYS
jgi:hypothetical protein